jgi:hypothetical protein
MFKYDENYRLVLDGKYTKEELKEKRIELESQLRINYNYFTECLHLLDTHIAIKEDLI